MDMTDLYIDGGWHKTAERFDVINPATEAVLASVASADIADADRALDAAERAMADALFVLECADQLIRRDGVGGDGRTDRHAVGRTGARGTPGGDRSRAARAAGCTGGPFRDARRTGQGAGGRPRP